MVFFCQQTCYDRGLLLDELDRLLKDDWLHILDNRVECHLHLLELLLHFIISEALTRSLLAYIARLKAYQTGAQLHLTVRQHPGHPALELTLYVWNLKA